MVAYAGISYQSIDNKADEEASLLAATPDTRIVSPSTRLHRKVSLKAATAFVLGISIFAIAMLGLQHNTLRIVTRDDVDEVTSLSASLVDMNLVAVSTLEENVRSTALERDLPILGSCNNAGTCEGICKTVTGSVTCDAGCKGINYGICKGSEYVLCKGGCFGNKKCKKKCEKKIVKPCKKKLVDDCYKKCVNKIVKPCEKDCEKELHGVCTTTCKGTVEAGDAVGGCTGFCDAFTAAVALALIETGPTVFAGVIVSNALCGTGCTQASKDFDPSKDTNGFCNELCDLSCM